MFLGLVALAALGGLVMTGAAPRAVGHCCGAALAARAPLGFGLRYLKAREPTPALVGSCPAHPIRPTAWTTVCDLSEPANYSPRHDAGDPTFFALRGPQALLKRVFTVPNSRLAGCPWGPVRASADVR